MVLDRFFKRKHETKENPVAKLLFTGATYTSSFTTLQDFIDAAFEKNPTVSEVVTMIASGAASVKIKLKRRMGEEEPEEVKDHPVLSLLDRPNPTQTRKEFFEQSFTARLVTGNAFLISSQLNPTSPPVELWNLLTSAVSIKPGETGIPAAYKFQSVRGMMEFPVNPINGQSPIYHSKNVQLKNDLFGMPPLKSGAVWVDVSNEGGEWNASLLANGASPSGILKKTTTGVWTDQQYKQIKDRWESNHQGTKNAGIPMILEGMDWVQMGFNPKDMDFERTMNYSDKKICGIYRVPYVLLSPDASTFNNVQNARRILWEDVIAPFLNNFLDSFDNWLLPKYKNTEDMYFEADYSCVPAYQAMEAEKAERVINMRDKGIITINEAREMLGLDKVEAPEADEIYIQSSQIPLTTDNTLTDQALAETEKFNNRNQNDNADTEGAATAGDSGKPPKAARKAAGKKTNSRNKTLLPAIN